MSASDWVARVRASASDDVDELRDAPLRESLRVAGEGLIGVALLYRLTVHICVVSALTGEAPDEDDVVYQYVACHVRGVDDRVQVHARAVTGVLGTLFGVWLANMATLSGVAGAVAVVNAAVLVVDPLSGFVLPDDRRKN